MSAVLIGIIGVILFIGLALAGALFLGPRFQEASISSKAATLMTQVSQVADAANLYALNSGMPYPATTFTAASDLVPGYMRSVPVNPIDPASPYATVTRTGMRAGDSFYVIATMPSGDAAERICQAIDRTYGILLDPVGRAPVLTAFPSAAAGCFKIASPLGQVNPSGVEMYVVFKQM